MKIFLWIEDEAAAIAVSLVGGLLAALAGVFLTIFVGARFFRDEWSYGVPLLFGIPAGLVAGIAAFVLIFRKMRRL